MVKNIFVFTDSDFEGAFMDQWVLDLNGIIQCHKFFSGISRVPLVVQRRSEQRKTIEGDGAVMM
ncbi:hypothetical protein CFP56_027530 [Quercus suber]|uniref:Uncharacterized protein n=1 Tax=Quercus suber TaxID=58331 RepID=A0AAW0JXT5_QUESU